MKNKPKEVGRVCSKTWEGVYLAYSYLINAYHAHGLLRLLNAEHLEVGDWVQFGSWRGHWECLCEYEPTDEDIRRYLTVHGKF